MQIKEIVKKYDTYKDSGIEWIGNIPNNWEIKRVKNAFLRKKDVCNDDNPVILSLTNKGIKYRDITTNEGQIAESYSNYNPVSVGNILLNPMDLVSNAFSAVSDKDGVISPAYINLKTKSGFCNRYYDYYFKLQYWSLAFFAHGKGVSYDNRWTLNNETLMNYFIPCPCLSEQQKIADYLDIKCNKIDEVIEIEKAVIEKLKEYKQSIITEAVTKGLDKSVPLKDSGIEWIGKIPEHWEVIKLKKTISLIADIDHYMPDTTDTGYSYLMTGDLKDVASKIDFEKCKHISESDYKDLSKKIHPILDDVIFARYATIGTVCYVDIQRDFLVSYSCLTIRPDSEKLFGKFLYYYLMSDTFKIEVSQYINSNTQSNVGLDSLQKVYMVLPDKNEQQQIAEYLDKKCSEIDKAIADKEQVIEKFTEYKKSLIYECVTGKRKVAD